MVIDINTIRKNFELVRKSQQDRFKDVALVDNVSQLDNDWRKERFNVDCLQRTKNLCSKIIIKKMKSGDNSNGEISKDLLNLTEADLMLNSVDQLKSLSRELDTAIQSGKEVISVVEKERNRQLNEIGNLLHPKVLVSDNEDYNGLIRLNGDTTTRKPLSHIELVDLIGGANFKMGRKNSGSRCYYLKGACVSLELALIRFGNKMMVERGYEAVSPPLFMNKDAMQEVAQLAQFDSELYKVICKRSEDQAADDGEEEKYLIATSEQPMVALYRDSWIAKTELPIRLMGVSECFRQEVGSHGRDTRGLFRVHQFKKVEQFCLISPHDGESDRMFEEMMANSEYFYQQLGIPYRVVSIVSGELNNAAAIKYDLEGWFPGSGSFRELVSCSNCTDYQARSVLARYGETKQMNKDVEFVHMLNCTLCATTRVICAILENNQTAEGIVVPEVLRPYMPLGESIIPFKEILKIKREDSFFE